MCPFFHHKTKSLVNPFRLGLRLLPIFCLFILTNSVSISAHEIIPNQGNIGSVREHPDLSNSIVVKIFFTNRETLNYLAQTLDIWDINHTEKFLIAGISQVRFDYLINAGYRMEIDQEKTEKLNAPQILIKDQNTGIPGYPCYRTIEETYRDMEQIASEYPNLAVWKDIGDSWQKVNTGDETGYDLQVLIIKNQYSILSKPTPKLFLMGAIHSREYATAETATRLAEHLIHNYEIDPDITWLLDYGEIHILPIANPDGRIIAENGYGQRKNLNNLNGGQCLVPPSWENQYGTDLNRNHTFHWGESSNDPCTSVYQGPGPASEYETQAIETYLRSIFPDQRGEDLSNPAPQTSTGLLITLHSYGELILWPWGWTNLQTPNDTQLATLGYKFGFFNGYTPNQSYNLYKTTGDTDDFAYGELGIAAYTFELGTEFFEGCDRFENTIYPQNLNALIYAAKAARRPYQNPSGPESINLSIEPDTVIHGTPFTMTAVADNNRYTVGISTQNISAGRYSIDSPSWITGTNTYEMQPVDFEFNESVEDIFGIVGTNDLSLGTHTIFIESQDTDGHWGVTSAAFVHIDSDGFAPGLEIPLTSLLIYPGSTLTQTIQLINQGITTDTFKLDVAGNSLQTELDPIQIGPIASGEKTNVHLKITAPLTIDDGTINQLIIQASSISDPTKFVERILYIRTQYHRVFTPFISR